KPLAPSSAPGAAPRSSSPPWAGAGTTAAAAAASGRTRRGSSGRPWSPPWRRPSPAELRHVTILRAPTIRHVTKLGRRFRPPPQPRPAVSPALPPGPSQRKRRRLLPPPPGARRPEAPTLFDQPDAQPPTEPQG